MKTDMKTRTSTRILHNIEYSFSKKKRQFLLLTAIFMASVLILFTMTSWIAISTTRSDLGGTGPVNSFPNYWSFEPDHIMATISYWQSPHYGLMEKIEQLLATPILIFGSYNPEYNLVAGAFQITLTQLVSSLSMSILLATYTNLWLLARKSECRMGNAAKGTGILAGGGGGASGIFSMLLLAGCCGGTGISILLFSLPLFGPIFSSFYSSFDTFSALIISVPANLLLIGLIGFMANKLVLPIEVKTKRIVTSWFKVATYIIAPAFFLFIFVMAVYWWNFQSIVAMKGGLTGGTQNMTVAIYATLPLTASLFLMSAYIELRRIFQTKSNTTLTEDHVINTL